MFLKTFAQKNDSLFLCNCKTYIFMNEEKVIEVEHQKFIWTQKKQGFDDLKPLWQLQWNLDGNTIQDGKVSFENQTRFEWSVDERGIYCKCSNSIKFSIHLLYSLKLSSSYNHLLWMWDLQINHCSQNTLVFLFL